MSLVRISPRRTILVAVLAVLLSGCGQNGRDPGARQIPAPVEAPPPPPRKAVRLDQALAESARRQLAQSLQSQTPEPRAHALEALQNRAIAGPLEPQIVTALSANAPLVRFAAAMTAGTLKLESAHAALLQMAGDPDANVKIAVRYALHRLGDVRYSHELERFSRDPRKEVRANTAMVLGMLGEASALRVLSPMTRDPEPSVRLQVAEAMWRLHDENALNFLVGMTVSRFPDDEMVALVALAEPRDQRVAQHLRSALTADYPEVRLVAARAMGMLGLDDGYAIAMDGAGSKDPRQRYMAALALGEIGRSDAQEALRKLLGDEYESVRVAAAAAILQLKA